MKDYEIVIGDCLDSLKKMDDCSVQSVITSPPYWGLRDYGDDGQVGLEGTPKEYVDKMVEIFREVRRVLRDDGTLWLNLGDSYISAKSDYMPTQTLAKGNKRDYIQKDSGYGYPPNRRSQEGLKSKDLVGIPWRVALALQADGWWLRQDIIWSKPNCMPESVKDRCTKSHEYVFLLTKNSKYYFDNEAIKEDGVIKAGTKAAKGSEERQTQKGVNARPPEYKVYDGKRNKRSVWSIRPKPFKGAHFAVFPEELVETCLLAGSKMGDSVLDPFGGSGTTAVSALRHGRRAILLELNPEYAEIAEDRINNFKKETGLDKEDVSWL